MPGRRDGAGFRKVQRRPSGGGVWISVIDERGDAELQGSRSTSKSPSPLVPWCLPGFGEVFLFLNFGRRGGRPYVLQRRGVGRRPLHIVSYDDGLTNVPELGATMLKVRPVAWPFPVLVLAASVSLAADSPALTALKEHGLTRSGRFFVIDAEKPALQKMKEARAAVAEFSAAEGRRQESGRASGELAQLEAFRTELRQRLEDMNQQINEQGFQQGNGPGRQGPGNFGQGGFSPSLIAQRNETRMHLAEVESHLKALKDEVPRDADRKAMEEEGKKDRETVKTTLEELRRSVDEVTKKYEELRATSSVKAALETLEKDRVGSFKLGPSPAFTAGVKTLENAERLVMKKAVTSSRKKNRSRR